MTTHSSQVALLLLLIVATSGCGDSTGEKQRVEANRLIQGWPKQGMYLPDAKEVSFFRTSLGATKEVLAKALGDPNPDIRQRAAYVIAELGPQGKPLLSEAIVALKKEDDRLIRIYLFNSLSAIGDSTPELLEELRMRFDKLKDAGDQTEPDGIYTPVDERMCAAGALYELDTKSERRNEYLNFVTQWLNPPAESLSPIEKYSYGEHRWMSVNTLGHMPHAQPAIPLLESMQNEPNKPAWVDVHVPRVLAVLRGHDSR